MSMPRNNPNPGAEDEWIGEALRRGDRWFIAPHNTPLPDIGEEPEEPWMELVPVYQGFGRPE